MTRLFGWNVSRSLWQAAIVVALGWIGPMGLAQSLVEHLPSPTAESLEDAWRTALANDQRLAATRSNLASAQSTWEAARAERLPSLTVGGNYLALSDQPSVTLDIPAGLPIPSSMPLVDRQSVGFHGLVSQPLYTFGRISSGIQAAQAGVQVNQAEVARARLDVKMNVAEIYVTVLRAIRIVEVTSSKVASLSGHNKDVATLYEKGIVSKNDLLAAQVALADAQQQSLQARNSLEVARAAYNRALGRPLTDPVQLSELRESGDPENIEVLTRTALQCRPEIAAVSAQARALREQAAGVRAKQAPQVGLIGGYVAQEDSYITPDGVALLALGVEWTAFDSGRLGNQANALCEKAEAMVRLRREAESMIALEVRQKWLDLETARQRVEVARQTTAQADENVRVARDRYQNQVGTNTEVLDAQTLRVQAYTNFYNSTYEAVLMSLRLRRAVGSI